MKKIVTLLFLFLLSIGKINAQSVTLSVVQPDCNHDGIIQVNTNGITPPYDVVLYTYSVTPLYIIATQSNITTFTTQINNLSGDLSWYGSKYIVQIKQGGIVAATSSSVSIPMIVNVTTPAPTAFSYSCPASAASVSLSINGGSPPYTIDWKETITSNYIITGSAGLLPEGTYNYTVTDVNGCKRQSYNWGTVPPVFVNYSSGITFSVNTTPANCTNGTASAYGITGGTAPYTYLWDNGLTTSSISNLVKSNNRFVEVADANGCYTTNYFNIIQTTTIVNTGITATNATCSLNNGSATAVVGGGQPPYSYLWQGGQTSQTILNQPSGYYQFRVTDVNGCFSDMAVTISQINPIAVTYTSTVSQCNAATGSTSLTLSGGQSPYSVIWNVSPTQTGTVLSNMAPGQYNFSVTDANGCIKNGVATIGSNSNLAGSIFVSPASCNQSNGGAAFYASSGLLPYTYQWSNGSTTSSLNNLPSGAYTCTLTDAANCMLIKSAIVYTTSPIQIGFNTTPASCIFSSDGAINSTVVNGTAPYTYQWSNGSNTTNLVNQATGNYYLTVSDANGCVNTEHTYLTSNNSNTNCYCIITGTVYDDSNTNCTFDINETGLPSAQIFCSGIGYTFTDVNGVYSFTVPAGTYTLTEQLNPNYQVTGCQNNTAIIISTPTSGCVIQTDFATTVIPVHDLRVLRYSANQAVPGNNHQQKMIIYNAGNYNENTVQLSYAHDGQLNFLNSTSPLTQPNAGTYPNWYTVNSGFTSIPQNTSSIDVFNYFVPTNVPAGTVVNFKDTVSSSAPITTTWTSDYTPWNNVSNYNVTVVSSYDPNFKEVSPKGLGPYGIITYNDTILEYVIHFQNTGTYYAQNIYVLDTLDNDLDWTTFQPGYADHNYSASMDLNGVVKFSFNNINLPWSGLASNGMVSYRIKTKRNLVPGTEFRNKAAIFFDYNAPIITNTTINSLQILSGIKESLSDDTQLNLYPNPTSGSVLINSQTNFNIVEVLSITGQTLLSEKVNSKTHQLQLQDFAEGIYFVKVSYADGRSLTKKVIKQ
jgi:hypothetical protein